MRLIVTGAAGFIGSNIIRGLNARGFTDIVAVDHLKSGDKFKNLVNLQIDDYVDKAKFYELFASKHYGAVEAIFHEGACSDTMEHDGVYMMQNNYERTCQLFVSAQDQGTRLLYASSAATYGDSQVFIESPEYENPLNVYGYSKLLFDQRMRKLCGAQWNLNTSQVVGFRYFNVYGPQEQHKARMASVAYHQHHQYLNHGRVKLFGGYEGYGPGEQRRDFIHVSDVVSVNLWFFDHPQVSGLFNLGSGRAQPFNDVALSVVNTHRQHQGQAALELHEAVQQELIEYIEFPESLKGKYQSYTQANLDKLRAAGCDHPFLDVQTGVKLYVEHLLKNASVQ
jgi:ADP-L-glycero-D-manno-heptose 6-epimerase